MKKRYSLYRIEWIDAISRHNVALDKDDKLRAAIAVTTGFLVRVYTYRNKKIMRIATTVYPEESDEDNECMDIPAVLVTKKEKLNKFISIEIAPKKE